MEIIRLFTRIVFGTSQTHTTQYVCSVEVQTFLRTVMQVCSNLNAQIDQSIYQIVCTLSLIVITIFLLLSKLSWLAVAWKITFLLVIGQRQIDSDDVSTENKKWFSYLNTFQSLIVDGFHSNTQRLIVNKMNNANGTT